VWCGESGGVVRVVVNGELMWCKIGLCGVVRVVLRDG